MRGSRAAKSFAGWKALGGIDLPVLRGLAAWQTAFFLVGLPGLVVAPLILMIREPRTSDTRAETSTAVSLGAVWSQLRTDRKVYVSHFAGMAAVNTYGFALLTWAPATFHRDFGWSLERTGTVLGIGIMLAGTLGMLASGHVADHLARNGVEDAPFRVLFVGTLLMVPVGLFGPSAGTGGMSAILFVVPVMGLFFAVVACAPTVLQIASPPSMRSSISAVYLFVVNIVAYALGPLSVGFLADNATGSDQNLSRALMVIAILTLPVGAFSFKTGLAPFRRVVRAQSSPADARESL